MIGVVVVAPDEVIYESRRKAWMLVSIAILFMVGGWFLVAVVSHDEGFAHRRSAAPFGVLSVALGTVTFIVLAPRALRRRPVLTLTGEGFIDGSVMGGGCFIPWTEVTDLSLMRFGSVKCIAGRVRRPERLLSGKRGWARWLSRINRRFSDFWIADSSLPEPAEVLIERMHARWRAATPD